LPALPKAGLRRLECHTFTEQANQLQQIRPILISSSVNPYRLYTSRSIAASTSSGAFRLWDKPAAHNFEQKQGSATLYPLAQGKSARFADLHIGIACIHGRSLSPTRNTLPRRERFALGIISTFRSQGFSRKTRLKARLRRI
jgi:hypothetical protein